MCAPPGQSVGQCWDRNCPNTGGACPTHCPNGHARSVEGFPPTTDGVCVQMPDFWCTFSRKIYSCESAKYHVHFQSRLYYVHPARVTLKKQDNWHRGQDYDGMQDGRPRKWDVPTKMGWVTMGCPNSITNCDAVGHPVF